MKEIDFLPEWYKSGRRRRVSCRTQYLAVGGAFLVMVVWNCIAVRSISKARAELGRFEATQAHGGSIAGRLTEVKNDLARLRKKAQAIEQIDSRIDVASVLGELSFLIDKRIVLKKVELIGERFAKSKPNRSAPGSVLRAATKAASNKQALLGDLRFKVVISGVAADAGDVARLICSLEDSSYFCRVIPSYSRNETLKAPGIDNDGLQVSTFEVSCYLANYSQAGTNNAAGQRKIAQR
jgi:hypothetical protein